MKVVAFGYFVYDMAENRKRKAEISL